MVESSNSIVLLFEDVEDAADALLALHALRDGTYGYADGVVQVPELNKTEIVDLDTVRERDRI